MRSRRTSRNCSANRRASVRSIGLVLALCTALPVDTMANKASTSAVVPIVEQPKPEFPKSESRRGREGWVVVGFTVSNIGDVDDVSIEDSSGSDAFSDAAREAVQNWRFEPSQERNSSVLFNFVYEQRRIHLSREFFTRNGKVHTSIDNGDLDDAQNRINAIRNDDGLNAYELAYSHIAEGRIAGERGDQVEQLRSFRRAMINHGRWLKIENYHSLLYATAVLEIKQHDFASALRDYDLLTDTRAGRKVAADLEEPMKTVRVLVEDDNEMALPYTVANRDMTIEYEGHIRYEDGEFRQGYIGDREPEPSEAR